VTIANPALVRGRRVIVIEDGPTLTHGGMSFGAGVVAARQAGAAEIIDPRPFAVGSIRATYDKYPNAAGILPAMGYGDAQIRELEETIRRTPADAVVIGTPIDLARVLKLDRPSIRVGYELREMVPGRIEQAVKSAIAAAREPALV
jgi:predicted GTPase